MSSSKPKAARRWTEEEDKLLKDTLTIYYSKHQLAIPGEAWQETIENVLIF
jgi:hypothetical protein